MEQLTKLDILKLASTSDSAREKIEVLSKTAADESSEFNETVPAAKDQEKAKEKEGKEKEGKEAPVVDPAAAGAPVAPEAPIPGEQVPPAPVAPAPEGPETIGARAAQSFIGEGVMQAAMSGDPNAANLIAQTAGQVAGAVSAAAANAGPVPGEEPVAGIPAEGAAGGGAMQAGAEAVPAVAGAQAAPAAPGTPEEDLANEIVPAQSSEQMVAQGGPMPAQEATPAAAAAPGDQGAIDQGKAQDTQVAPGAPQGAAPVAADPNQPVDLATVAKLVELAKAGKI